MGVGFAFFSEHRVDNVEMFLSLVAGWGETTTSPNLGSDEVVFCISQLSYWAIFEYILLWSHHFEDGILRGEVFILFWGCFIILLFVGGSFTDKSADTV